MSQRTSEKRLADGTDIWVRHCVSKRKCDRREKYRDAMRSAEWQSHIAREGEGDDGDDGDKEESRGR